MSSFLDKISDIFRKNSEIIGVIIGIIPFVLCQFPVNESDSKVKELTCTRLRGKQTCYSTNTSTNEKTAKRYMNNYVHIHLILYLYTR